MTVRHKVFVTTPLLPHFNRAVEALRHRTNPSSNEEFAFQISREIQNQVASQFEKFDGHADQPKSVRVERIDTAEDFITAIVSFESPEAAMLFKLTYGGE